MGLSDADRSLLSSVVLYVPLGLLLFVVFLVLRLEFPRFYAARRAHGYPSPPSRSGLFGWIRPTLGYTERDMLSTHGLDAVMILRVGRTCFYMLVLMFLVGWLVIAPVNASGGNKDLPKYNYPSNCTCIDDCSNCKVRNPLYTQGLGVISLANISPTGGRQSMRLFAHLISVYLVTIFGMYLLYMDWRAYADLRVRHLSQRRIAASTVLVRGLGLPRHSPLDEAENGISAYFARLFPSEVTRVIVAASAHPIRRLMTEWNKAVVKAEKADEGAGLERWAEKKSHLRARITEMQTHLTSGTFALVTFRSRVTAALVSSATLTSAPDILHPRHAPEPHDVNWKAANTSVASQRVRALVVFTISAILILFWSIPVTFAASIANVEYLSQQSAFRWLRPAVKWSPVVTGAVSGILPALVVLGLSRLLMLIIRLLSRMRRLYSFSEMDNTIRNIFFSFQFINVVLIFTVSAALFRNLKSFLDALSFNRVVDLLAVSLPPQVTFFSTYVLTAAVLDQMLDLVRPGDLILMYIKRKFAKTPREKEEAEKPECFDYAKQYAYLSLFLIICLVFWLLSPLITLWGVLYFGLHYLVMKYNLLYGMRQHYEAGGHLWPAAFSQMAFGLVFFQAVMFGVFLTFRFPAAPAVLPLIPITTIVAFYTRRQWEHVAEQGALERLAHRSAKEDEDEEGGEVDPVVLHEGDYAQPERQRLQDDVIDLHEY